MDSALWMALGASIPVLLIVIGLVVRSGVRRERSAARERARAAEAAAADEVAALRAELEELRAELAATRDTPSVGDYVITTAGRSAQDAVDEPARVSDRVVLSATLGEPLVKVAALTYGVRRALSPQSRNRIAFAMRREVKRARKERRRALRRARVSAARVEDAA